MNKEQLLQWCEDNDACSEALDWLHAQNGSVEQIYANCTNIEWLEWLYMRLPVSQPALEQWETAIQPARKQYDAATRLVWEQYIAATRLARKQRETAIQTALEQREAAIQTARKQRVAAIQTALEQYKTATQPAREQRNAAIQRAWEQWETAILAHKIAWQEIERALRVVVQNMSETGEKLS